MIKKSKLQIFAAPTGTTVKANINTRVREIDFVTSFEKNIEALQQILGITRFIKKENGSLLKTKSVSGTLSSGTVGEGEEIPRSPYTVTETVLDSISIEKYRKSVSIEAIAEKGYAAAVADTDEEFKADLETVVMDRFYRQLSMGSLTAHYSTFQMAFAMALGKAKDKFKTMHRTATGMVAFVNTLDVYEYVGAADITVQTAFGMDYIENFLGAETVFISSEIPRGKIYATPLNNIVAYYVDPGDSEFAQAGLPYTVSGNTNLIGFHVDGDYNRALSDAFALMGFRLFAEYLDGIAKITFGSLTLTETVATGSDILGKAASDLMDGVTISNGFVKGKLKYVTGYTQFSGKTEEQSGNYLAFVSTATGADKITVELTNSVSGRGEVQLDSDGIMVARITDKDKQKLLVRAYKDGAVNLEVLDLADLEVATA